MEHGTPTQWGEDQAAPFKARLGLWMFAFYTVVYFAFVLVNSARPELMALPVGGLNVAVLYGLGLIAIAFVMALIYNVLSGRAERSLNQQTSASEEGAPRE